MNKRVRFYPEHHFREQAERVYQRHRNRILATFPQAEIHHIGSTAVEGSLTKGDVDLQVRIREEQFLPCKGFLLHHYSINTGSTQTHDFCAFETNHEIAVGIQLTVKNSSSDFFFKMTRFFVENPAYTQDYNQLKKDYDGADMEDYLQAKAAFLTRMQTSEKYKQLLCKLDLYQKVKFVEGENFVTIEETKHLTTEELPELIHHLAEDPILKKVNHLSIVVKHPYSSSIEECMKKHGFSHHDTMITVKKDLAYHQKRDCPFTFKSLPEISEEAFILTWERCMSGSLNSPSYLNMKEQMGSIKKEIGPAYEQSCKIAYEGDQPAGVVIPHIEEGTKVEGRLFYFGMMPEARGKGKGALLHYEALTILKDEFKALYNVGGTSIHNIPMQKVFLRNGCEEEERNSVYRRSMEG
ncbi:GrpB family protein [Halobacillus rhizosphaerae]|uniref:GrpB family protein n=1 Tax=Halobacillus rhizosphaerae TaxID=3064889 RepID=UPI00398B03E8